MSKNNNNLAVRKSMSEWFTLKEAIQVAKRMARIELTEGDIYRYALSRYIYLSIYFQSPVLLRKVKKINQKLKLRPSGDSLTQQLCMLDSNSFTKKRNLMISTKGRYFFSSQRIIDTDLSGHEYVLVQRLLALSLHLPLPVTGANENNFGITVYIDGVRRETG
ncbi:hypothetical protein [Klebsiella pneumoniae]|uniref:hypothetical protein n=1 Tax=Klebsiella pneumoniae TaxID=573 RepID=UPI0012FE2C96|nr:hypothetical protein [Klebsiella pneumoniae]